MKKKPSLIFSILLNVLSNLEVNEEHSINEISEKSGLHWQTTNEYLRILTHLLKFSPKIKINDNNKIQVIKQSEFLDNLSISQRILVTLYESKSFGEKSSIRIKNVITDLDLDISLEELTAKQQIKKIPRDDKYFITKQGKVIVISLYSDMTKQIYNLDDNTDNYSQKETFNETIEKLNLKYSTIINQNNEILLQNRIIMLFLGKLGYKFEGGYREATEFNLQELTSSESSSDILSYFQKRFNLKKTFQTYQEVNINIKTSDKISSDYEYSEFEEIYKILQENLKNKAKKKQIEVIR